MEGETEGKANGGSLEVQPRADAWRTGRRLEVGGASAAHMPLAVYAAVKIVPSLPIRSMRGVNEDGATGKAKPGSGGECQPVL